MSLQGQTRCDRQTLVQQRDVSAGTRVPIKQPLGASQATAGAPCLSPLVHCAIVVSQPMPTWQPAAGCAPPRSPAADGQMGRAGSAGSRAEGQKYRQHVAPCGCRMRSCTQSCAGGASKPTHRSVWVCAASLPLSNQAAAMLHAGCGLEFLCIPGSRELLLALVNSW